MTTRREGELIRLKHSISRARAIIDAMEKSVDLAHQNLPIGYEQSQALIIGAAEIAGQIAKHDAYQQIERDAVKP